MPVCCTALYRTVPGSQEYIFSFTYGQDGTVAMDMAATAKGKAVGATGKAAKDAAGKKVGWRSVVSGQWPVARCRKGGVGWWSVVSGQVVERTRLEGRWVGGQ